MKSTFFGVTIYAVLTDPRDKFLAVLPDGRYKAKILTIEEYRAE